MSGGNTPDMFDRIYHYRSFCINSTKKYFNLPIDIIHNNGIISLIEKICTIYFTKRTQNIKTSEFTADEHSRQLSQLRQLK